MEQQQYPVVLTIAGSDSGGGAGIQADLKTIAANHGYGVCALTALTAQNGLGVDAIHAPEPAFVEQQIKTVLAGFPVAAAKTGMLFSLPIIQAVASLLAQKTFPLVVDPVSVSQSGYKLLLDEAVEALIQYILPLADLLTPNKPEAELIAGMDIHTPEDIAQAIKRILAMGPKAVLLKGGHFDSSGQLTDWLGLPDTPPTPLPQPKISTPNNHGTGCTLSAAIATNLAHNQNLQTAIKNAQAYLATALKNSYTPGQGTGPPNHMANLM